MAYLGKQPVLVSTEFRDEFNITSTANTVVTSGFVNSGISNYLEVYRNGVLLGSTDYTLSTDNKTINLVDSAASGDIIVVTGRREINQGLKVTERRHEHVIQSGETTVTFPFPLTVDGTDVHINGVKLWYGNGSGDGTNSDFAINVNTKVVSFGVNPSVGDVVCIVSREPTATTSTPLPITDSNGTSIISESNGKVTLNNTNLGGSVVPNSSFMFRNKIINGGMQIDQRNAGSSVTPASGGYTVDRWVYEATQSSKVACQQVSTAPTRFVNSLKLTSQSAYTVAAGDVFQIVQRIEGSAISELAWGTASASTVTLSFKAYSSLTGTFGGFLRNSASDRYYVFTYSIPVANTWTDISITIPGDTTGTWLTTNGYGLGVAWSLGCGSTYQTTAGSWGSGNNRGATGQVDLVATNGATLYITAVQLEEGTVATPFEHRPIGMELSLAQRYFFKGNSSVGPEYLTHGGNIPFTSRTSFPVTMNHSPDMTNLGFTNVSNSHSPSFVDISADGFGFRTNMTAGLGVGTVRSTIVYSADAEL